MKSQAEADEQTTLVVRPSEHLWNQKLSQQCRRIFGCLFQSPSWMRKSAEVWSESKVTPKEKVVELLKGGNMVPALTAPTQAN